jgi:hypothetical protein
MKQLKRSGRVHDPSGVMNMGPRDLMPKCPACPHPGRNLDPKRPPLDPSDRYSSLSYHRTFLKICSWLEEKVLAVDACFKLSQKGGAKSRSDDDPELASGNGVFVNEDDYQSILKKNAKLVQVTHHFLVYRGLY